MNMILHQNLDSLKQQQPLLEQRLRMSVDGDHIRISNKNQPQYLCYQTWRPFVANQKQIHQDTSQIDFNKKIYLFGSGFGEYIAYILENYPDANITVWERDPMLLRLTLTQRDYSKEIATGQLHFLLNADITTDVGNREKYQFIYHPFFSTIYHLEKRFLEQDPQDKYAVIGLGGLFVADLAEALSTRGYNVLPIDFQRWAMEEITLNVKLINPSLIFSINYVPGLSEFCEEKRIIYFCWEIDPHLDKETKINGSADFTYIFTYRHKNIETFKNAGCPKVWHLPLAANTEKRHSIPLSEEEQQKYNVPLAFVGNSMVQEAARNRQKFIELYCSWHPAGISVANQCEANIQEILDRQLADGSCYLLPELFKDKFAKFRMFLLNTEVPEDPLKLLAEVAAAERRLTYVASLGKYGLHVWGDDGWKRTETYGVTYRGYAGHNLELSRIYNSTAIHVDIGRIYQQDIVTMRVFDVLSCGGFLIAEYSNDLAELFSIGEELEAYRTIAELEEKIIFYMNHPDKARQIAIRGQKAVHKKHTIKRRLDYMLSKPMEPKSR